MKKSFLISLGALLMFLIPLFAADPTWWSTGSTAFIDSSATPNNYAPLNVGQLKNVAGKAKAYLDTQLSAVGGSGPTISAMVSGFSMSTTADYQPANLGQLKAVAQPFYDRLNSIGYGATANLITRGYPSTWTYNYPWNPSTSTSQNYTPANLGQLKMVFSFDLSLFTPSSTLDAGGDGLPDAWQVAHGLNPFNTNPNSSDGANGDPDGDGLTNIEEYGLGLDPQINQQGNPANSLQYQYDALGRLTNVSGPSITGSYIYDVEGSMLQVTNP